MKVRFSYEKVYEFDDEDVESLDEAKDYIYEDFVENANDLFYDKHCKIELIEE